MRMGVITSSGKGGGWSFLAPKLREMSTLPHQSMRLPDRTSCKFFSLVVFQRQLALPPYRAQPASGNETGHSLSSLLTIQTLHLARSTMTKAHGKPMKYCVQIWHTIRNTYDDSWLRKTY